MTALRKDNDLGGLMYCLKTAAKGSMAQAMSKFTKTGFFIISFGGFAVCQAGTAEIFTKWPGPLAVHHRKSST